MESNTNYQESRYVQDYVAHCTEFGFKPEWRNKTLELDDQKFKLIGFNYGGSRGLALERLTDHKIVCFKEDKVREACKAQIKLSSASRSTKSTGDVSKKKPSSKKVTS